MYARVVERYSGGLKIGNRVENDYTRGTKVEIWLLKTTAGSSKGQP